MENVPVISIIVPVYNKVAYLKESVESILNQTYKKLEIILVDDGSHDGSELICDEYADRYDNIFTIHKKNEGQVSARKCGISKSKGKYIGFVDADDWIDSTMFEVMISEMESNLLDFVSSGIISDNGSIIYDLAEDRCYITEEDRRQLITSLIGFKDTEHGIIGNAVTKVYKKDLLKKTIENIPNEVHYREDDCLVYSYIIACKRIKVIKKAFYHYRFVPDSDANNIDDFYFSRINQFYCYLKKVFAEHDYLELIKPKLDVYFTRTIIEGINRGDFDIRSSVDVSFPALDHKRIAVYGAGKHGTNIIRKVLDSKEHTLVAVFDKNWKIMSNREYIVHPVEEIDNDTFEILLVTVVDEQYKKEIADFLQFQGVDKQKIAYV